MEICKFQNLIFSFFKTTQRGKQVSSIHGFPWLELLVSIDAALVLSGGVLTSYVGVVGLVRRMALDRCLPNFLLQTNRFVFKMKNFKFLIFSFSAILKKFFLFFIYDVFF
jgi:amino acid transporter